MLRLKETGTHTMQRYLHLFLFHYITQTHKEEMFHHSKSITGKFVNSYCIFSQSEAVVNH